MASKTLVGLDLISVSLVMGDEPPLEWIEKFTGIGGISVPHSAEAKAGGGGRADNTTIDFAAGSGQERPENPACWVQKSTTMRQIFGIAEKDQRRTRY